MLNFHDDSRHVGLSKSKFFCKISNSANRAAFTDKISRRSVENCDFYRKFDFFHYRGCHNLDFLRKFIAHCSIQPPFLHSPVKFHDDRSPFTQVIADSLLYFQVGNHRYLGVGKIYFL